MDVYPLTTTGGNARRIARTFTKVSREKPIILQAFETLPSSWARFSNPILCLIALRLTVFMGLLLWRLLAVFDEDSHLHQNGEPHPLARLVSDRVGTTPYNLRFSGYVLQFAHTN